MSSSYLFQTEGTSPSSNLGILLGVSENLGPIFYVIRLIHNVFFINIEQTWGTIYNSAAFVAMSFIIPILIFSSLVKLKSKLTLYFGFLTISGIFLAKGTEPPLGEFFQWVFINLPAFQAFRNPFEKLGIILPLGYAPLFGLGLFCLYRWISGRAPRNSFNSRKIGAAASVVLICFLILGIYVFPMWNGLVFTSGLKPSNNPEIGSYVSVPEYYEEANSWLRGQSGDFRLILLPIDGTGITYNWTYGYSGVELTNNLLDIPSISAAYGAPYIDDVIVRLEPLLVNGTCFWKAMALLNARYVVVRWDVDYALRGMRSPQEIQDALRKNVGIEYIGSFGKLDFYQLDNKLFLPRIYAASQFTFSENISTMLNDIVDKPFNPKNNLVFLRSQSNTMLEKLEASSPHEPAISFEKIDPTKYVVHVRDADSSYFLAFSELYHPQWSAYINGEEVSDHLIANGYANAWYIDKNGSYDVTLEFKPERMLLIGFIVSISSLGIIVVILIFNSRRKKTSKISSLDMQKFWNERAYRDSRISNPNTVFTDIIRIMYTKFAKLSLTFIERRSEISALKTDLWNEGVDRERGSLCNFLNGSSANMFGVDFSSVVCKLARYREEKLEVICSDVRALPFKDQNFHVILDISTLDHVNPNSTSLVISEYARILRKEGILLLIFDSIKVSPFWLLREHIGGILNPRPFAQFWFWLNPIEIKSILKTRGFKILKEYSLGTSLLFPLPRKLVFLLARNLELSRMSKYLTLFGRQYAVIAKKESVC